uniref:Uncharacterized protein n=1 Tax=Sphaerodactylus townsendi TaxID=933632 RepID=A0ACB8FIQ0_9SAUR
MRHSAAKQERRSFHLSRTRAERHRASGCLNDSLRWGQAHRWGLPARQAAALAARWRILLSNLLDAIPKRLRGGGNLFHQHPSPPSLFKVQGKQQEHRQQPEGFLPFQNCVWDSSKSASSLVSATQLRALPQWPVCWLPAQTARDKLSPAGPPAE